MLEQLAGEYADRVRVVKLNTDENPRIASQLGIQGIPAVFAFREGELFSQFVGALPEPEVRRFFDSLFPTPADEAAAAGERARDAGDIAAAKQHFEAALAMDPLNECAGL